MQVTLNFPPWIRTYDGGATANAPRGLAPLTPNAAGQVSVDPSVVNLGQLLASGFTVSMLSGATANRPGNTYSTQQYFDSTLGYVITRNLANTSWVGPTGSAV